MQHFLKIAGKRYGEFRKFKKVRKFASSNLKFRSSKFKFTEILICNPEALPGPWGLPDGDGKPLWDIQDAAAIRAGGWRRREHSLSRRAAAQLGRAELRALKEAAHWPAPKSGETAAVLDKGGDKGRIIRNFRKMLHFGKIPKKFGQIWRKFSKILAKIAKFWKKNSKNFINF